MASVLNIGISRNAKCDNLVGFPKSGHIFGRPMAIATAGLVYTYNLYAKCSVSIPNLYAVSGHFFRVQNNSCLFILWYIIFVVWHLHENM